MSLRRNRHLLLLFSICFAAFGLGGGRAHAAYPDHPITLIVPFAPGASLEVMARIFTPYLSQLLGQQVVILDKPGADGIIGLQTAVSAAPDGYTLVFSGGAEVIGPVMHRNFPYDPQTALRGVALIGTSPSVLGVSSKIGVDTFAQFADYAKKNSGQLNASASGNSGRLGDALLALSLGIKAEIVPFDGNAQATTSVASGESDFSVQDSLAFIPSVRAGRMKILVVADTKRLPSLPDIPTAAEVGVPGFIMGVNPGVYAPSATPSDIIDKLNGAINQVLQMPEVKTPLLALDVQAPDGTMSAQQFNTYYLDKLKSWKDVVTRANIPPVD